ncbi:hypothetical protein DID80_07215 [Candidatus Marinamargulisbacteria bacterium SCGC AAA071-K20]|nr:hypothetical protein DID80_07215 [Candidatus Marinamargulisbacteria bacterium SCGC AAA071-K20]
MADGIQKTGGGVYGVKPGSKLAGIMGQSSKHPHPVLAASTKRAVAKAIQEIKPKDAANASAILDKTAMFSPLGGKSDISTAEYKQVLKEKDTEIMTHALTNGKTDSPRPDQKTLARMIVLGSMGDANYSPASLFLHGGRTIFDCQTSSATMESVMLRGENISEQTETGITPRESFVRSTTISSHSLIVKDGNVSERKHNAVGSLFRGTSGNDPEKSTLFQQHLGLNDGEQSGTQGSMILVTDKSQTHFMVGIEGSSFGEDGSEINHASHSILGTVNKYSAANQIKGSAIKKTEGLEDFPGDINEGTIKFTDTMFENFKTIDDWLNADERTTDERMDTLNSLMQEDNAETRHQIVNTLVATIKDASSA